VDRVPAILPLLPAPVTLLPLLPETEAAQNALQGEALQTAFLIGVGVASGDILVSTYQRYRERIVEPAVGRVSVRISKLVGRDRTSPAVGPDDVAPGDRI